MNSWTDTIYVRKVKSESPLFSLTFTINGVSYEYSTNNI